MKVILYWIYGSDLCFFHLVCISFSSLLETSLEFYFLHHMIDLFFRIRMLMEWQTSVLTSINCTCKVVRTLCNIMSENTYFCPFAKQGKQNKSIALKFLYIQLIRLSNVIMNLAYTLVYCRLSDQSLIIVPN